MKKTIGFMIIVLSIIVVILLLIMMFYKRQEANPGNSEEGKSEEIVVSNGNIIKYPENTSDCFAAIRLVEEYMNYVVGENKEKLINIVSEKYIDDNSISVNNIMERVKDASIQYSENYEIILNNIYVAEASPTFQTYFIDLSYYNTDNKQKYVTKLMLELDFANSTYQVIPYQYMKEKGYDNLTIGNAFNSEITQIKNRKDNTYNLVPISKDSMAERYFYIYSTYLMYDKEASYYLLNKEYREKRFGSATEYIKYVNESNIENAIIRSYKIIDYDDYTAYICMDNNGNYYIFNEKSVMNFDLILDTYTIDVPEFVEKYETSNTQQKVALNIDKFIKAINAKDYKYAYNCLADSFKNNYFKTQAEFEAYVKNNFYEINEVSYNNFETQGNLYIYSVTIKDSKGDSIKQKTFIVELRDGTDFVLSFEV